MQLLVHSAITAQPRKIGCSCMCCAFVRGELSLKPDSNMIHSQRNQSPSSGKVAAKYRTLIVTFKGPSVLIYIFF